MNEPTLKKTTLGITAFVLVFAMANTARSQTRELGASGELLDGIAALVDTGIVLKSELDERVDVVIDNFRQQQEQLPPEQRSQLPPLSVLEQQVLDQLILEEIQIQRAQAIGMQIGDDVLNQVLAEVAASIPVALADLPDFLASIGVDYAKFREDQRRDLMMRQLERREVVDRILINPRELEQCLARSSRSQAEQIEHNISHILIGFGPDAGPDEIDAAEETARDIVRQLDEGVDFAQLAVAHSESATALEGGLLGWRAGSELPTIFADEVLDLEVGEHSDPIRSSSGYHLVQLNDRRGAEPELVDQIRARHILLVPTEVLDDDATRQRLQGIRDQIVAGDDFGSVAAAVSEDTVSAIDGGDLGWSSLDDYVAEFSGELAALEIGELSEPFRTQYGWHIAEVTGRRTYDMSDDLLENQCRNQIGNAKAVEEVEIWRQRIRSETYVDKRL